MNKILASIFALFLMCSVSFGQTKLTGPQRGTPGGAGDPLRDTITGGKSDPCSCVTATYMFCYNGDMSSAPGRACFTNGTNWKDGTTSGTVTVSAAYVLAEAINSYISWAIADKDGISDVQGTLFLSFFVVDDGDADLETTAIFESFIDANNKLYCYANGSANKVDCYFVGNGTSVVVTSGTVLSVSTWYRLGYTWFSTVDGTGGKHKISVVALGNDPSWGGEESEALKNWTSGPDDITLGEKDSAINMTDDIRIADVVILSGYAADDPLQ